MKVTVIFEDHQDYDGNSSTSSYSKDLGEGTYEKLLYTFGRAAIGAGYDWESLTATVSWKDDTGKRQYRNTVAHF
jgi:hypothetical protein